MNSFDRLPLLARFIVVGAAIAGVRAYLDWLPDGPLGLALFTVFAVVALLVVSGLVRGIVTGSFTRAYREGGAGNKTDMAAYGGAACAT
jgi:hypothetical protein